MNTNNNSLIVSFVWSVADDILRDVYVKGKYRDVILPMVVLTRIDSELVATKSTVLAKYEQFKNMTNSPEAILHSASGYPFYNISPFTLSSLLNDPKNIASNFRQYLNGFSSNIQDILQKFKFLNQIETLEENDILYALIAKFVQNALQPPRYFLR